MMVRINVDDLRELRTNQWFGCLTRPALVQELRRLEVDRSDLSLVYFDIDNLKDCNNRWGKDGSSMRIRAGLRGFDLLGSWFSGDEFVAVVPDDDARGLAERFQRQLRENGMSATFLIAKYNDLASIDAAEERLCRIKNVVKGCVIDQRDRR